MFRSIDPPEAVVDKPTDPAPTSRWSWLTKRVGSRRVVATTTALLIAAASITLATPALADGTSTPDASTASTAATAEPSTPNNPDATDGSEPTDTGSNAPTANPTTDAPKDDGKPADPAPVVTTTAPAPSDPQPAAGGDPSGPSSTGSTTSTGGDPSTPVDPPASTPSATPTTPAPVAKPAATFNASGSAVGVCSSQVRPGAYTQLDFTVDATSLPASSNFVVTESQGPTSSGGTTVSSNADGVVHFSGRIEHGEQPATAGSAQGNFLDLASGNNYGPFHVTITDGDCNQAPTAKASVNPTSGTTDTVFQFSSAGSSDPEGKALTYAWNFGDGTTSTAANPTHQYASAGDDTATLTVTDSGGKTGTDMVTVRVTQAKPVTKPYSSTTPLNTPKTVTVSDVVTNPAGVTFTNVMSDKTGAVSIDPTGTSFTYTPEQDFTGRATISYTVNNAGGSTDGTAFITVLPAKDADVTFAAVAVPDCPAGYSYVQYSVQHGTPGTVTLDGTATTDNPVKVGEGQVLSVPVTADDGHTDSNGQSTFTKTFTGPKVANDCPPLNAPVLSTDMPTYTAAIGGTQMATFSVTNTSDPAPENLPASYVITVTAADGSSWILPASMVAQDGDTVTVEAEFGAGTYTAKAVGSDVTTSNTVTFQVIASAITTPPNNPGGPTGPGNGGNPISQGSGQPVVKPVSYAPSGQLASTGVKNIFALVGGSVVFILLGVGLVLGGRRKRTDSQVPAT